LKPSEQNPPSLSLRYDVFCGAAGEMLLVSTDDWLLLRLLERERTPSAPANLEKSPVSTKYC